MLLINLLRYIELTHLRTKINYGKDCRSQSHVLNREQSDAIDFSVQMHKS